MDAIEHLARLDDAVRLPFGQIDKGVAAGPVDTGDPKYRRRDAALGGNLPPGTLRGEPRGGAARRRVRRGPLAHPGTTVPAVDADRREIADPGERRRGNNIGAMVEECWIAGLARRDRTKEMGRALERLPNRNARRLAGEH